MSPSPENPSIEPFTTKMTEAGMPGAAIDSFVFHLERYLRGDTGTLGRDRIEPVSGLPDVDELEGDRTDADRLLDRTVVVKLNGGLGTSMGLESAKSLIEVRPGETFLDLIARQVLHLRSGTGARIPLLLMNSFRTAADTERSLAEHADLDIGDLPPGFMQHMVPKILEERQAPATWPADPELEWCPPGHGDVYTALHTSGLLQRLVELGFHTVFMSNSDNLGAVLDPRLLGHFASSGAEFMMEVADRTPADRKGGHLCRLRDGRLALRESAQCPPDEVDEFQDTDLYRYFNTNNIWLSLPALARLVDRHGGFLPLDTIVNPKHLDPRDPGSPPVIQLETAMGAAISLFDHATAVRVPRRRFSPVKSTDDLLAVRSDAFVLEDDGRVVLAPGRSAPPDIRLDPRYYKMLDEFDRRFPAGPPSLVRCARLEVDGNVTFGEKVVVEGEVSVRGGEEPSRIPDGAVLRSEHRA